jgi:hypothetical protein
MDFASGFDSAFCNIWIQLLPSNIAGYFQPETVLIHLEIFVIVLQ